MSYRDTSKRLVYICTKNGNFVSKSLQAEFIFGYCSCSGLPKRNAILNAKQVELLIDTGATVSKISLHILQQNFQLSYQKIHPQNYFYLLQVSINLLWKEICV